MRHEASDGSRGHTACLPEADNEGLHRLERTAKPTLSNSRVIPLLLDLEFSEVSGPLAQFQSKKVDEDGMGEAIQSINRSTEHAVPDGRAKQLFDALWSDLHKKLEAIPAPKESTKPVRSQHQILEELVASVRSLEAKLRDVAEMTSNLRSPRHRRFGRMMHHPMMLADMMGTKPGDPVMLLMFGSLCRDEAPWLYELTMDAYRAAKAGNRAEARETLDRLRRASKFLMEGPFLEEVGADPRMLHMLFREMEHMLQLEAPDESEPSDEESPKARRKRPTKS